MIEYIVERSANHAHLTEQDALAIFGEACFLPNLTLKPLAIVGEYATNLKVVDVKGNSYTVVYPWRKSSQIEVAQSDYYKMFKTYTNRVDSGDIGGAKHVEVAGAGGLTLPVLVVRAHIHIDPSAGIISPDELDFIFPLAMKVHETIDGVARIHLDTDQYAAICGMPEYIS